MNKVWTVHVVTESADHYIWVYAYEPTREDVVTKVWMLEGECEELDWYMDTTSVYIDKTVVIENRHD